MDQATLEACLTMLKRLKKRSNLQDFKVTKEELISYAGYMRRVEHPIDFQTIEKSIKANELSSPEAFVRLMRRMASNCLRFCLEGTNLFLRKAAKTLLEAIDREVEKLLPTVDRLQGEYSLCLDLLDRILEKIGNQTPGAFWERLDVVLGEDREEYIKRIRFPIDLGRLTAELLEDDIPTTEFLAKAEIVFKNCIQFWEARGSSVSTALVSQAKHILVFLEGQAVQLLPAAWRDRRLPTSPMPPPGMQALLAAVRLKPTIVLANSGGGGAGGGGGPTIATTSSKPSVSIKTSGPIKLKKTLSIAGGGTGASVSDLAPAIGGDNTTTASSLQVDPPASTTLLKVATGGELPRLKTQLSRNSSIGGNGETSLLKQGSLGGGARLSIKKAPSIQSAAPSSTTAATAGGGGSGGVTKTKLLLKRAPSLEPSPILSIKDEESSTITGGTDMTGGPVPAPASLERHGSFAVRLKLANTGQSSSSISVAGPPPSSSSLVDDSDSRSAFPLVDRPVTLRAPTPQPSAGQASQSPKLARPIKLDPPTAPPVIKLAVRTDSPSLGSGGDSAAAPAPSPHPETIVLKQKGLPAGPTLGVFKGSGGGGSNCSTPSQKRKFGGSEGGGGEEGLELKKKKKKKPVAAVMGGGVGGGPAAAAPSQNGGIPPPALSVINRQPSTSGGGIRLKIKISASSTLAPSVNEDAAAAAGGGRAGVAAAAEAAVFRGAGGITLSIGRRPVIEANKPGGGSKVKKKKKERPVKVKVEKLIDVGDGEAGGSVAVDWTTKASALLERLVKHINMMSAGGKAPRKTAASRYNFDKPVVLLYEWMAQEYLARIKRPMDLSTARLHLRQGDYDSPQAFIHDVDLIFANAIEYNDGSTDPYLMELVAVSRHLQKYVDALALEMLPLEEDYADERLNLSEDRRDEHRKIWEEKASKQLAKPFEQYRFYYNELRELINQLRKDRRINEFFAEEVSRAENPNYYAVIQQPMCFKDIIRKMENGSMRVGQVIGDLNLIWQNALQFNSATEDRIPISKMICDSARRMKRLMDEKLPPLFLMVWEHVEREGDLRDKLKRWRSEGEKAKRIDVSQGGSEALPGGRSGVSMDTGEGVVEPMVIDEHGGGGGGLLSPHVGAFKFNVPAAGGGGGGLSATQKAKRDKRREVDLARREEERRRKDREGKLKENITARVWARVQREKEALLAAAAAASSSPLPSKPADVVPVVEAEGAAVTVETTSKPALEPVVVVEGERVATVEPEAMDIDKAEADGAREKALADGGRSKGLDVDKAEGGEREKEGAAVEEAEKALNGTTTTTTTSSSITTTTITTTTAEEGEKAEVPAAEKEQETGEDESKEDKAAEVEAEPLPCIFDRLDLSNLGSSKSGSSRGGGRARPAVRRLLSDLMSSSSSSSFACAASIDEATSASNTDAAAAWAPVSMKDLASQLARVPLGGRTASLSDGQQDKEEEDEDTEEAAATGMEGIDEIGVDDDEDKEEEVRQQQQQQQHETARKVRVLTRVIEPPRWKAEDWEATTTPLLFPSIPLVHTTVVVDESNEGEEEGGEEERLWEVDVNGGEKRLLVHAEGEEKRKKQSTLGSKSPGISITVAGLDVRVSQVDNLGSSSSSALYLVDEPSLATLLNEAKSFERRMREGEHAYGAMIGSRTFIRKMYETYAWLNALDLVVWEDGNMAVSSRRLREEHKGGKVCIVHFVSMGERGATLSLAGQFIRHPPALT